MQFNICGYRTICLNCNFNKAKNVKFYGVNIGPFFIPMAERRRGVWSASSGGLRWLLRCCSNFRGRPNGAAAHGQVFPGGRRLHVRSFGGRQLGIASAMIRFVVVATSEHFVSGPAAVLHQTDQQEDEDGCIDRGSSLNFIQYSRGWNQ